MKPEKKLPLYGPELSEKDYEAIKISEAQIERGEVIELDEAFKLLGKKYSKQWIYCWTFRLCPLRIRWII